MKILLVCSGGMSTSIVVKAVEKKAAELKEDIYVEAVSTTQFEDRVKDFDVVLIAPQVKHRKQYFDEIASKYEVPTGLIEPQAYGPFGGEKIIQQAKKLLKGV
ncbi:Lichenan-specific phosphotransferase enzyme IIB component [Fervidicola ferrireducens]|uniref:Lichenan-specific phosphotransferase enzyme IIB component n=1 Tax=Fervidicola ferrireducens TaxID=520764 RepID=A0A140LD15_9FIRM|nr:PTS sugar transporter subunit IIB [Fervidicola ferrireducens]KXG78440.1 Lichenan-specific phosphotransferase enzyme IIB component [Fervidicola ferrireducens]